MSQSKSNTIQMYVFFTLAALSSLEVFPVQEGNIGCLHPIQKLSRSRNPHPRIDSSHRTIRNSHIKQCENRHPNLHKMGGFYCLSFLQETDWLTIRLLFSVGISPLFFFRWRKKYSKEKVIPMKSLRIFCILWPIKARQIRDMVHWKKSLLDQSLVDKLQYWRPKRKHKTFGIQSCPSCTISLSNSQPSEYELALLRLTHPFSMIMLEKLAH